MNKKIITLIKMLVLSVGLILIFNTITDKGKSDKNSEYSSGSTQYGFSMGTSISATLYGENVQLHFQTIMEKLDSLDNDYISWRNSDSELSRLNSQYVVDEKYPLSELLYEALDLSWNICKDSKGALDITIRPLAQVWNIEEANSNDFYVPDMADIKEALSKVGYEKLCFWENESGNETIEGYISIKEENMIIDLGATGKGYALDILKEWLVDSDIEGACISVGGSVLVYGSKDDGSDWKVGIRDPQGASDEMIGYLEFSAGSNICVSTSGDYEKYFLVDGVRYHHILDRVTGKPADSGLTSVTVVCENGLVSDALSTACFVLGYEDALELLEKYNAEAVFIDKEKNIILTDGLENIFIKK